MSLTSAPDGELAVITADDVARLLSAATSTKVNPSAVYSALQSLQKDGVISDASSRESLLPSDALNIARAMYRNVSGSFLADVCAEHNEQVARIKRELLGAITAVKYIQSVDRHHSVGLNMAQSLQKTYDQLYGMSMVELVVYALPIASESNIAQHERFITKTGKASQAEQNIQAIRALSDSLGEVIRLIRHDEKIPMSAALHLQDLAR